ncbi:MAG: CHAT domain-containing protein [Armatimonadota bacterium]
MHKDKDAARTTDFLPGVFAELQALYRKAIALFETVPLATESPPASTGSAAAPRSTALNPSAAQISDAAAIGNELRQWAGLILTFLERYSAEMSRRFMESVDLLLTYVLFQRTGQGISEELWRHLFRRESQAVVLTLTDLLQQCAGAFTILGTRRILPYAEFTLKVRRNASGSYLAEAHCAQGEAEQSFAFPYDERDLETFLLRYCRPQAPTVRGWVPTPLQPFSHFGQKLFDALLSGEVRDLFHRARQHAAVSEMGLRVKLRLGMVPELGGVPWEFLFDGRDLLCLSLMTPITRYLDSGSSVRPLATAPPLRVLVTASVPEGTQTLDIDAERQRMLRALAPLIALGALQVDWSPDGRLRTLQRMLRMAELSGKPYHIWHYIGHGRFDNEKGSVLLLEDTAGRIAPATGFELGTMFGTYPSLKLAILNACEGARAGREDGLSGAAVALVERGMAAVIAMQFEITQETAVLFSEEFYSALVDGIPIDSAVTEARRAIFFEGNPAAWATPVLFMRSDDGILFDLSPLQHDEMR